MKKKEKLVEVNPIEVLPDGSTIYHLCASESNADWVVAARLAKKKDKKSKKELERMDNARMLVEKK